MQPTECSLPPRHDTFFLASETDPKSISRDRWCHQTDVDEELDIPVNPRGGIVSKESTETARNRVGEIGRISDSV